MKGVIIIKQFILLFLAILSIMFVSNKSVSKITIPKQSIRFRIIASSNTPQDQLLKQKIQKHLEKHFIIQLNDFQNIDDVRLYIKNNLSTVENLVKTVLKETNSNEKFKISYGANFFPNKIFNDITYDKGNYESLVITLGNGAGDNWWCVLFPPLCLLEAQENEINKVEYKFYVQKIINKLKNK